MTAIITGIFFYIKRRITSNALNLPGKQGFILTRKMKRAPKSNDTTINCSNPRRNIQLNPNKCNMAIAKYNVMKLHHATHVTNMKNGPLKNKRE